MKTLPIFSLAIILFSFQSKIAIAQDWKPVQGNVMTKWAADVTPDNVWKEYPRPLRKVKCSECRFR
jgi:hypothetical protein